jgi:hypothetical protein
MIRMFLKMLADDVHPAWAASRRMPGYPVGRVEPPPASGDGRVKRAHVKPRDGRSRTV